MEKEILETGKQVALEVNVPNLRPRELFLIGRLKYRTSYGQNVLDHAREVAFLSGMLAKELKLDEALARRAGLLHDIGKAVDHEEEGTHPEIGSNIARRCEEPEEVINSIASHHEGDVEPSSLYAVIVQIADAISAARPGARRETLEKYIKRLEKLESIASNHAGIDKAFAIQAGREVRVIARPDKLDDKEAHRVCREIAQQIQSELSYPGEVKVTLIRENRFVEYAR
jgi:ribonucrease Y